MFRSFAATVILMSCLTAAGWAQSSPTDVAAKSTPARSAAKGAAKTKPAEGGSCQIGVIPIAGNLFLVEKFGPIGLADTYERVSVDGWALDELVVSRVRAAAPGMSVRRIPFTKEELANYPRPAFRVRRDETVENSPSMSPAEGIASVTFSCTGMAAASGNSALAFRSTTSAAMRSSSP
jgi:hypothetical protein